MMMCDTVHWSRKFIKNLALSAESPKLKKSHDQRDEAEERVIPLVTGFFLFWLMFATDFPFWDKFLMTSLFLGIIFILTLGMSQATQPG